MDQLLSVVGLGAVPYAKSRRDDDYADRVNHRTTVAMFILFAVLVSTKQFVGNPISCWMPSHFHKDTHDDYANRCTARHVSEDMFSDLANGVKCARCRPCPSLMPLLPVK